jgi:hypothetical protein
MRREFLRQTASWTAACALGPAATIAALAQRETPSDLGIGASLHGMQVFPRDNPWNTPIAELPVDPNSDRYIESIGRQKHLHPDFGHAPRDGTIGIPYVVVGRKQGRVPIQYEYVAESDPGPFPIPPDAPIEGGRHSQGDRHVLVIDRDDQILYELFGAKREGMGWKAVSGATFNLRSNRLRTIYWTSADAAGLPIFPGLVRAEEVFERGKIDHALRFTCKRTRRAFTHPARHFASKSRDRHLPPMGMRVRLKANFNVARFSAEARIVLTALKEYGMFLADNGGDWYITGAPDPRFHDERLAELKRVRGEHLEVVCMDEIVEG